MSDEIMANETATDAEELTSENQATSAKTYTQEEFDNHMAGLKSSLTKKFEKQFQELGDIEELKQLKIKAERAKEQEAIRKGEFEKILSEKAEKWNSEIQKRDSIIEQFKVEQPLLSAAGEFRSINPEQVKRLLRDQVRLSADGEVEVLDAKGTVRYNDNGQPITVKDLVKEFLDSNPHFVQATPSTTNSKHSVQADTITGKIDLEKLDMTNPADRKIFQEAKRKGLLNF